MPQAARSTQRVDLQPVPVALLLPSPRRRSRRPRPDLDRRDAYGLTPAAAATLIAAYTHAGDLIVDLHPSPAVQAAADWLDRRYAIPSAHAGQAPLLPMLIIDRLPRREAADPHGMAERIRALRSALLPGGHLIIAVPGAVPAAVPGRTRATDSTRADDAASWTGTDPVTDVISAARAAGLTYQQQLVTVHEPVPEPAHDETPRFLAQNRHPITHGYLLAFRCGAVRGAGGGGEDG